MTPWKVELKNTVVDVFAGRPVLRARLEELLNLPSTDEAFALLNGMRPSSDPLTQIRAWDTVVGAYAGALVGFLAKDTAARRTVELALSAATTQLAESQFEPAPTPDPAWRPGFDALARVMGGVLEVHTPEGRAKYGNTETVRKARERMLAAGEHRASGFVHEALVQAAVQKEVEQPGAGGALLARVTPERLHQVLSEVLSDPTGGRDRWVLALLKEPALQQIIKEAQEAFREYR